MARSLDPVARRRSAPALAIAVLAGLALAATSAPAAAQGPAGSLAGSALLADGDVGGGALLDLWAPFDWFRIGGFFGAGVMPSDHDTRNRVMMPIGASIAAHLRIDDFVVSVRGRGGLWGGATQEVKLTAGGFVGGGLALGWALSDDIDVFLSAEFWGIFGAGETWCLPLSLGIEWGESG